MASHRRSRTESGRLETTFLIPNLHCPTCVGHIEFITAAFGSGASIKSISIIEHSVTILHDSNILVTSIRDELTSAGYEVFDLILDPRSTESNTLKRRRDDHLDDAVRRWDPKRPKVDDAALAEHDAHCQMCASHRSETKESDLQAVTVASSTDNRPSYIAIFSIEGMTCSSCVGNVGRAVEELPSVSHAEVALVSHSATVYFNSEDVDSEIPKLTEAVEDVGYGAELVELKPQDTVQSKGSSEMDGPWQVTYAIEGMTCGSCASKITDAVDQLSFVKSVDINVVSNAGSIVFDGKDHEPLISEAIEDTGYGATKTELKNLAKASSKNSSRTVHIRIDGMHCPHCPERILVAANSLNVEVQKAPSTTDPIITIIYTPDPPDLSVRSIINAIGSIDKAFTVSVNHPPSIEERSRRMLARERKTILLRVLLCIVAAIPTLILGVVYMNLVSHESAGYIYLMQPLHGVTRLEWATFTIATPVYFFATDHFHRRTLKEVYALWRPKSSVPLARRFYRFGSMNMLISLGTTIAYVSSLAQLIIAASNPTQDYMQSSKQSYFDSVVFLTLFLLVGRFAEAHMKAKSGDAVAALGRLRPTEALLMISSIDKEYADFERVNVDLIDPGDVVKVPFGTSPPCDGLLLDDAADFDESSLTGESRLAKKKSGDLVYSGTINKGSPVSIRVTGPAGTSMLDSIIQVVREGQGKRAPVERVADLLTSYFVPVVVAIAIITWLIWLALGLSGALPTSYRDTDIGGWPFWSLQFAIAVFVIACPCGLGLAAPTALFVGSGLAASKGILVKGGGEAFQEASSMDCIVFDKTGTLTEGVEPKMVQHHVFSDTSADNEEKIMGLLKAVEENSNHPLARAAVQFALTQTWTAANVISASEIAGKGVKASISLPGSESEKHEALVGNESLLQDYGIQLAQEAYQVLDSWKGLGYSVILLATSTSDSETGKWELRAAFAAADPLRTEAAETVSSLQQQGMDVWMLSGDNAKTATAVGSQVGIPPTNVIADVLPTQKAEKVKFLQKSLQARRKGLLQRLSKQRNRATIAMVGDGINDAPALAAADVGIAVASGSDVAIQSASFVLVHSDLRAVLSLTKLSRAVFRRVLLNFFWAAIYNIVALPIAAGALYAIKTSGGGHVRLAPAWAALAMALSSVSVVGSSLLLRTRLPAVGFRERSARDVSE